MSTNRSLMLGLILTLPLSSFGTPKEKTIGEYLGALLPEKISKFEPGKTTESEIVKALGKAAEIDQHTWYYELNGVKYDLSIEVENGVLHSLTYDLPVKDSSQRPSFNQFKQWINENKMGEINHNLAQQKGHDRGKLFDVNFQDQGISLQFKNIEPKVLKQIQLTIKTTGKK